MLFSILGDVGSGKTLLATYMAYCDTRPVYANYKLKLPNYRPLKPETMVKLSYGSLVIIDEAYTWVESRMSGRAINLFSTYVLFQSRKRGTDIIITDQLASTIDVRYRLMTNYEIHCEAVEQGFDYRFFKLSNWQRYKPKRFIMPYSIAEKLYPLYDTLELVSPIDDDLLFKVSKDKTDIIKDIDIHVKVLSKLYPPKAISKGIVMDYCLRNEVPKSYVEPIFNSIKASRFKNPSV